MRETDQSSDSVSANSTGDLVRDTECLLVSRTVTNEFQNKAIEIQTVDRNS